MSRVLLLLVLMAWLTAEAAPPAPLGLDPIGRHILIFGGFGLIVLIPALWSRVLARYVVIANLSRSLQRYNLATQIARAMIPLWFGVAVFALGWVQTVNNGLGPIARWNVTLPGTFLGTLPPLLTWAALWWASFPADRALREQSLMLRLESGLPVYAPPGFWSYFGANLRMQILFTVIPVALVLLLRDLMSLTLLGMGVKLDAGSATIAARIAQNVAFPLSVIAIFVLAPEILRRILHTQPLPDSPLRRRLEEICRRSNLRYRDILLWRTGNNMGNAAVMGIVPQVRYILLSDVLLQTMTDRQIEAVFAHEVGHVAHRHLAWYGVFMIVATVILMMLAKLAELLHIDLEAMPPWLRDPLMMLAVVGTFFLMFGLLSRCFERQADVYAARTMEQLLAAEAGVAAPAVVGPEGARLFASALERVATINNIPVRANNFSHGSIAQRMIYLRKLSGDPGNTARFDRFMSIVFKLLALAFAVSIVWLAVQMWS